MPIQLPFSTLLFFKTSCYFFYFAQFHFVLKQLNKNSNEIIISVLLSSSFSCCFKTADIFFSISHFFKAVYEKKTKHYVSSAVIFIFSQFEKDLIFLVLLCVKLIYLSLGLKKKHLKGVLIRYLLICHIILSSIFSHHACVLAVFDEKFAFYFPPRNTTG